MRISSSSSPTGASWWRGQRQRFELGLAALGALRLSRDAGALGRAPPHRLVAPALAGADGNRARPRSRDSGHRHHAAARPSRRCGSRAVPRRLEQAGGAGKGSGLSWVSPLSARYASPAMQALWGERRRIGLWRRLWLALMETERDLGLAIPDTAITQLRAHLDDADLEQFLADWSKLVARAKAAV